MFRNRFKTFGGKQIPDVIQYLKDYISKDPNVTISVGCDSIQRRKRTVYACTIMLYNMDVKNGAHVIFFRENVLKIRDNFERLHKEATMVHEIASFLNTELSSFYERKDLSESERKRYKFHLMKCNGECPVMMPHQEEFFIKRINLSSYEKDHKFELVDIHVDFNPEEGSINERGVSKNKSYMAYRSYTPWLRGLNFRVFAKNIAFASTSAADLLLKD